MNKKFLVAGGDLRSARLSEYLAKQGAEVYAVGFDSGIAIDGSVHTLKNLMSFGERADHLILPLPVSNDGININTPYSGNVLPAALLCPALKEGGLVFGGRFSDNIRGMFAERGFETVDYSQREEFAVLNAQATAEGAVQAAMEETLTTLSGQKILIIGMGRIARLLVQILKGFNADVTAAARKYSDLAWAEVYGCGHIRISELPAHLKEYSVIFNTAPAVLLDNDKLRLLDKDCLVIDLASKPGGVDFETAASLGIRAVWLLSLPGKAAPVTAGINIGRTIFNILSERGEEI